jgi:hypothetical protein
MCITGKSFGTGDTRVIIGTRDSVVQVWKISGTAIENVFSVKIPRTVPSAAAFVEHSQDVLVFGREDGALCVHIIWIDDSIDNAPGTPCEALMGKCDRPKP